jgi:hypothetical protein
VVGVRKQVVNIEIGVVLEDVRIVPDPRVEEDARTCQKMNSRANGKSGYAQVIR